MASRFLTSLIIFLISNSYADTGLNIQAGRVHLLGQFVSATGNGDAVYQYPKAWIPLSTLFNSQSFEEDQSPLVVNFFLPIVTCPIAFTFNENISVTMVNEHSEAAKTLSEPINSYEKRFFSPANIKLFSYKDPFVVPGINLLLYVPPKVAAKKSNIPLVLNFIYP